MPRLPTLRWSLALLPAVLLSARLAAQESAPPSAQRIATAARELDRLLAETLRSEGVRAADRLDDEAFCRRAFLTILGRIPTLDELDAFLGDRDSRKRDGLVDRLLVAPGHASHEFNTWADVLRLQSRMMRQQSGEPYIAFVKQALAENLPYDVFVRKLLIAEGPANARDNGATGYMLRDLGMPLDNLSNTMRVFLGTRMECAQCHDHPYDRWTQRDFYQLAAFTGGLRYQAEPSNGGMDVRALLGQSRDSRAKLGQSGQQALRLLARQIATGVSGSGTASIALPKDYKYEDARPGAVVHAKVPFGQAIEVPEAQPAARGARRAPRVARRDAASAFQDVDSRPALAGWITSPENPRFTKVIVNRMWKQAFGLGLFEPVDEFRDDTVPTHPEVLAYLEDLMREFRYDLRAFQRVLYRSALFGRESIAHPEASEEPFRFAGPALRRMSAEQLWDSVLTIAIGDPDATLKPPAARAELVFHGYESLVASVKEDLAGVVERESLRYTDPAEYRRRRTQQLRTEMEQRTASEPGQTDVREELRELTRALAVARRARDPKRVASLQQEIAELRLQTQRAALVRNPEVARASELSQPARAGHFLREFGQSDRDQIDSSTLDANVPQALRLMNGIVDTQLLAKNSLFARRLDTTGKTDDKIKTAFLSILGRRPGTDELRTWHKDLDADPVAASRDLVWTLVNCQEFRFVR